MTLRTTLGIYNAYKILSKLSFITIYLKKIYYLVVVDGDDSLVEDGSKTAGAEAVLADSTAEELLLGALAILPLRVNGGRQILFTASHLSLKG